MITVTTFRVISACTAIVDTSFQSIVQKVCYTSKLKWSRLFNCCIIEDVSSSVTIGETEINLLFKRRQYRTPDTAVFYYHLFLVVTIVCSGYVFGADFVILILCHF